MLRSIRPPPAAPRASNRSGSRVFTVAVILLVVSLAGFLVVSYWPGSCIAGSCATKSITSFTFPTGSSSTSGSSTTSFQGGTAVSGTYSFPNTVISGSSFQLTVQVANSGAQIQQAKINVTGSGFDGTSNTFSMPASSSAAESVTVSVKGVNAGNYKGELVVMYYDAAGAERTVLGNFSTYVALPAQLSPVSWQGGGSSIGPNGTAIFDVSVTNLSPTWVNSGLKVQAVVTSSGSHLTLTPSNFTVADVGPRGTGQSYNVQVIAHSTPPGSYNIEVFLYAPNGYTLYDETTILTVTT